MNEPWREFAAYDDAASAEVIAGLLRSERVPVHVAPDEPVPGLARGFRVMIPESMLHRAKWIVSQAQFSDEELTFIATGKHSGEDDDESSKP